MTNAEFASRLRDLVEDNTDDHISDDALVREVELLLEDYGYYNDSDIKYDS